MWNLGVSELREFLETEKNSGCDRVNLYRELIVIGQVFACGRSRVLYGDSLKFWWFYRLTTQQ
jgi:hypothetical protein